MTRTARRSTPLRSRTRTQRTSAKLCSSRTMRRPSRKKPAAFPTHRCCSMRSARTWPSRASSVWASAQSAPTTAFSRCAGIATTPWTRLSHVGPLVTAECYLTVSRSRSHRRPSSTSATTASRTTRTAARSSRSTSRATRKVTRRYWARSNYAGNSRLATACRCCRRHIRACGIVCCVEARTKCGGCNGRATISAWRIASASSSRGPSATGTSRTSGISPSGACLTMISS
mmetsp:Transcript_22219/g.62547  ORF Transcript_22219/g.62547 Transcript_22219/m.62547 type:complete len:230 (-) Transcript_22219:84-773(-)